MKKIVKIGLFVLLAFSATSNVSASSTPSPAPLDLVVSFDWQEYKTVDGIKIEYKYQEFETGTFRNSLMVLFRYSNISSESRTISWSTEEYRNEICANCENIANPEYARSITLSAGEVLEGTGSDVTKTEEYLFSNFITLVPGMTNQRLTDFQFVNINVSIL